MSRPIEQNQHDAAEKTMAAFEALAETGAPIDAALREARAAFERKRDGHLATLLALNNLKPCPLEVHAELQTIRRCSEHTIGDLVRMLTRAVAGKFEELVQVVAGPRGYDLAVEAADAVAAVRYMSAAQAEERARYRAELLAPFEWAAAEAMRRVKPALVESILLGRDEFDRRVAAAMVKHQAALDAAEQAHAQAAAAEAENDARLLAEEREEAAAWFGSTNPFHEYDVFSRSLTGVQIAHILRAEPTSEQAAEAVRVYRRIKARPGVNAVEGRRFERIGQEAREAAAWFETQHRMFSVGPMGNETDFTGPKIAQVLRVQGFDGQRDDVARFVKLWRRYTQGNTQADRVA